MHSFVTAPPSRQLEIDEKESQQCISSMMLPLSDEYIQVSRYTLLNAGTNFLLNYSLACSVLMPPTLLTNLLISWTQEKALAKKISSYLSAVLARVFLKRHFEKE